jgi:hypothetical protein
VLALSAKYDHADAIILVERLEDAAKLVALAHRDGVHRRAGQHDIGALALGIDLDAEAVEVLQARI